MINLQYFRLSLFALAFLLLAPTVYAQKTPNQMLYAVVQKMSKVKDYSAEANIRSDIPMIRILPVNAKVYFKQKDKFKVESKGIVLLPKQGFNDFYKIISDSSTYTAILTGQEKIQETPVQVINVIPALDTSDLILAKLWIDAANNLVLKSQLTTRTNGTMLIEYTYGTQKTYGLPDRLVFTVDVKKFKIPKGVATDLNKPAAAKPSTGKTKNGQIFINLTNYKVNAGVSDAIFKK